MIIVTPTVLETPEDIKAVFKRKLAERDEYVRQIYGKENDDYDIPKDFDDRVGVAETIRQVLAEEKRVAREGAADDSIIITPDSVKKASPKDEADEADEAGSEPLVPLDFKSAPPPETISPPIPAPPPPPVPEP